jgi:tRNA A37 threonylcarbamoyladenosine dehydratase
LLIGEEKIDTLQNAHVLIVGLGGIGSYAAEFIARAGVGTMTIIDGDVFDPTNKNRQLTALDSTIGKNKAAVLGERLKDINPKITLHVLEEFVVPERVWEILEEYKPDVVMDCIDSVTPKIEWIAACIRLKIKIVSHFGAGGKMDPTRVQVTNLPNTYNCKLAAHVKKRLRKRGVTPKTVRAVFSSELQLKESLKMTNGLNFKRSFYGTVSYMPALFGLHGASDVLRYLTRD